MTERCPSPSPPNTIRYPEARAINRRIIFHMGPTNSGKTFHALQRFVTAKSGVYCGPLKLLAAEVFEKCNNQVGGTGRGGGGSETGHRVMAEWGRWTVAVAVTVIGYRLLVGVIGSASLRGYTYPNSCHIHVA